MNFFFVQILSWCLYEINILSMANVSYSLWFCQKEVINSYLAEFVHSLSGRFTNGNEKENTLIFWRLMLQLTILSKTTEININLDSRRRLFNRSINNPFLSFTRTWPMRAIFTLCLLATVTARPCPEHNRLRRFFILINNCSTCFILLTLLISSFPSSFYLQRKIWAVDYELSGS